MNICQSCSATTIEELLRRVSLLNTKGVHALVKGRHNCISRSIKTFKVAIKELEQVKGLTRGNVYLPRTPKQQRLTCYLEAFHTSELALMNEGSTGFDDSYFVYSRAIVFRPLSDASFLGMEFYTAILKFNIALAYHIKSKLSSSSSEVLSCSNAGLKYYKKSLKVLRDLGVTNSQPPLPGGGETMIHLRLAALNNMAHLHTLSGNQKQAQQTLKRAFLYTLVQQPILLRSNNNDERRVPSLLSDTITVEMYSSNSSRGVPNAVTSLGSAASGWASIADQFSSLATNPGFINEVLLNVMVSGPVSGAPAA